MKFLGNHKARATMSTQRIAISSISCPTRLNVAWKYTDPTPETTVNSDAMHINSDIPQNCKQVRINSDIPQKNSRSESPIISARCGGARGWAGDGCYAGWTGGHDRKRILSKKAFNEKLPTDYDEHEPDEVYAVRYTLRILTE